ncbi:MAG: hypothetical protein V1794_17800 [Candidatus Glassbacteria bacterium]
MFALLITSQQKIETLNDAIKTFETKVVTAVKIHKGFRAIYLLTDHKTGKTISLSLWDSKNDAYDNEQSGYYQAQMDEFKGFSTASSVFEGYEVSVQG